MNNTVEFTLRLRAEAFERSIKAGAAVYRGEIQGLERATTTGSRRMGDAMQRLGVRPFGTLNREIRQLKTDYQTLARSGQLSGQELTRAHVQMQEGVRKLTQEKSGWVRVMGEAKVGMLALAGAGYGLVRMLTAAGGGASEFATRMAEVFTLIDVSPARFAELTQEVRALAVEMGVKAPAAAQALYDIISAGVPEGNAINVLRQSTRAAVAGVTDTQSAARVGLAVVNAYGKEIDQLGQVYDVLFTTVKNGVTTLPQLSATLGQALPIAAAAKVPFEEVAASIASMTQAGLDTAVASTSIRAAITALSTPVPEAKKVMDELGISWNGLYGTLEQIARLNLDPETLRQIVPDVTARTGVLALTRDIDALAGSIENMHNAAGATDEAYDKMANTPEQRMREFRAAMAELALQIGDLVTAGTPLVEILTRVAKGLNELPAPVKGLIVGITALVAAKALWVLGLRQVWNALRLAASGLGALISTATGIAAMIAPTTALGGAAAGAAAGISLMNKAMRLTAVGLTVWSGKQVWDLVDAHLELKRTMEGIADRRQTDAARLVELVGQYEKYANVQVLTAEEVARLSDTEQQAYRDRILAAKEFYEELRDVGSRVEADVDPSKGPSEETIEAARQARLMREALEKVNKIQAEREASMKAHQGAVTDIKKQETEAIKDALAEQLQAYDEATKDVEKAQQARLAVEEHFKQVREQLLRGPKKEGPTEFMDMVALMNSAKQALAAGDFKQAIDLSKQAADALLELQEAGDFKGELGKQQLLGFLSQMERTAKEAATQQEGAAKSNLESAEKFIAKLVAEAEFLKKIEIGFDHENAERSAEQLRQQLQAKLQQNPIVMPVVLQDNAYGKKAGELLDDLPKRAGGGLLEGPGTETSDSILMWGSKNEYMLRAKAVRHYGLPFVEAINRMRLPKFASGGLVGRASDSVGAPTSIINNLSIPSIPKTSRGGDSVGGTPVYLSLAGQEFALTGQADTAAELQRTVARENLKRGRRR